MSCSVSGTDNSPVRRFWARSMASWAPSTKFFPASVITANPGAAVFRRGTPSHQSTPFQSADDIGGIVAVDSDFSRHRYLIHTLLTIEDTEHSVLDRCDIKSVAFFLKDRHVNLVQTPDQKSWP